MISGKEYTAKISKASSFCPVPVNLNWYIYFDKSPKHMAQLRQNADRLAKLDIEVFIAGPENADSFRKYWEKESMPFKGLPAPHHFVMNLYGQEVKIFKLGRMPAQMLIDKSGILKFAYYGNSMTDIPDPEETEKASGDF